MKKIILNIEGMTCSACSNGLEKYLKKQKGIISASVNLVMATALIEYEDNLTIDDLNKFVVNAGFKSLGERREESKNNDLKILIFFSILGALLMYLSMGNMLKLPIPQFLNLTTNPVNYVATMILLTTVFLFYGFDIIKNGLKNLIHKMPNMDSLVGIGVLVNFIYSFWNSILIFKGNSELVHNLYFESSAIIILFVKIGRYIDRKNKSKAVDAIKSLVTITPKKGRILKDGKELEVTINEISKGDIVLCKPGEKIAVDGKIIKGNTHTDESFITGESKPVTKKAGSQVIAGSLNYDGYIEYKAEKIGIDSSISNIVKLVVEATSTKAPIAKVADKISGVFVPVIFAISLLTFVLNLGLTQNLASAITSLVSVLVVACPCALGLATPLAMVVAIGNCSKNGILIKSSESLEAINKIDTVVFDKTGTLTNGKMTVTDGEYSEEQARILKSLEKHSNHPLAKSICESFKSFETYEIEEFNEVAGRGVQGKTLNKLYFAGNKKFVEEKNVKNEYEELEKVYAQKGESIVYLFDESKVVAIFGLSDEVKNNMKEVIENLKLAGKKVVMLTGDNETTARSVAEKLQIKEVIADVLPSGKLEKIRELNNTGKCLMIGDGVNDSPALKSATVGVSVAGGTDISADSADVILLNEDMNSVNKLFNISHKAMRIIKENLFWALFYNVCMIPLATGLFSIKLNPMIASFAMTFSSLTVVFNSLRLKK